MCGDRRTEMQAKTEKGVCAKNGPPSRRWGAGAGLGRTRQRSDQQELLLAGEGHGAADGGSADHQRILAAKPAGGRPCSNVSRPRRQTRRHPPRRPNCSGGGQASACALGWGPCMQQAGQAKPQPGAPLVTDRYCGSCSALRAAAPIRPEDIAVQGGGAGHPVPRALKPCMCLVRHVAAVAAVCASSGHAWQWPRSSSEAREFLVAWCRRPHVQCFVFAFPCGRGDKVGRGRKPGGSRGLAAEHQARRPPAAAKPGGAMCGCREGAGSQAPNPFPATGSRSLGAATAQPSA
jgi:hypothetical protein